jgi:hypothetical protein
MLLEPLEHATKLLSASSYPTIADVKLVFSAIQEFLEEYIEDDDLLQYELAGSINTKLDEYRSIIDKSTIIATILNPQAKLSNFQPGSESSSAISNLRIKFQEYLDEYSIIQELNPPQTNSQYNYRKYFQQLKNHKSNNQSPQPSTLERYVNNNINDNNEIERYLALPCDEVSMPLAWWQDHQQEFLILAKMARDFLSIQATSVACEQSFSVAGNTVTSIRNRLHPETARAILCSKSWIENNVFD